MTNVQTAISSLMDIVGTVVTTITGNSTLMLFLGASLVGIGVGIFRKLKG